MRGAEMGEYSRAYFDSNRRKEFPIHYETALKIECLILHRHLGEDDE